MNNKVFEVLDSKMEKTLEVLKEELAAVRAGRANPAILDKVMVEYYGVPTPLKQLANISVPDAKTIMISPFDSSALSAMEHGINEANIGINPNSDGKCIRLILPPVTEERRKELTKEVKQLGEEAKVAIRNLRRVANDELKKIQKEGLISEDQLKDDLDKVQKTTDNGTKFIDDVVSKKEKEIMEV